MTRRNRRGDRHVDRGGAVVFGVVCLGLLLFVGATLAVVVALVVDHRRAQSAADLAALAAATAAQRGADPCGAAGRVAVANGAHLLTCAPVGMVVTVAVAAPGPRWLGQRSDLRAEARAGPG